MFQIMNKRKKIPKSFQGLAIVLLTVLATLSPVLSESARQKTESQYIKVGEEIDFEIKLSEGGLQIFSLEVAEVHLTDYMFISIDSKDEKWVKFSINVYKDLQLQNLLMTCDHSNFDVCLVKGKETSQQLYTVVAKCEEDCSFTFKSYWDSMQTIHSTDQPFPVDLVDGKRTEIFELVPGKDAKLIKISAVPIGGNSMINTLSLFGSVNQIPTPQTHQFYSQPLWNKGQGLFIQGSAIDGKPFYVLFVGEQGSSYEMSYSEINSDFHDMQENVPVHDYIPQNKSHKYRIDVSGDQDSDVQLIYTIVFEAFNGNLKVGFYTDEAMTNSFQTKPVVYRGKSKYVFPNRILKQKGLKTLYAKLISSKNNLTVSSYLIRQRFQAASQLQENSYTFVTMDSKHLMYFSFKDYGVDLQNGQPRPFQIDIFESNENKNTKQPKFRVCQRELVDCTSLTNFEKSTTQISDFTLKSEEKTGSIAHKTYSVSLDKTTYKKLTKNAHQGIIVIEFDLIDKQKDAFAAVFFNNYNHIERVPQKTKQIQGLVEQKIKNVYYFGGFANNFLEKITIHLITISGEAKMFWTKQNQQNNPDEAIMIQALEGKFEITQNFDKPFIFWVEGITQSMYIIQIERQQSNKIEEISDIFKLIDNLQQDFMMKPHQMFIMELHPNDPQNLVFDFDSSGRIGACQIYSPHDRCQQGKPIVGNKRQVKLLPAKNGKTYVRMFNTNVRKSIEVTVRYHSGNTTQCVKKTPGKIYEEISNDDSCMYYDLSYFKNDIEVTLVRNQLAKLVIHTEVCGQKYTVKKPIFTITRDQIEQLCGKKDEKQLKVILKSEDKNPMKMTYCVQQNSVDLLLPDGIAFTQNVFAKKGVLRKYAYNLINKVDTEIILHNKIGRVNFYVKVFEGDSYKNTAVDKDHYDFANQAFMYSFNDPRISISSQFLLGHSCVQCVLSIAVYADDSLEQGQTINYSIEVTQNSLVLHDHQALTKFLSEGSTAYFKYHCTGYDSLYFYASDNHQQCSKVYAGRQQYPTNQNAFEVSLQGTIITQCSIENPEFFFAVEAIKDCPVTVAASSAAFWLNKLQKNVPFEYTLSGDDIIHFMYAQYSDSSLKITSLQKYGDVEIYVTQATNQMFERITGGKELDLEGFSFKNTFKNQIEINKEDKGFCKDCMLLIAVKAESGSVDSQIIVSQKGDAIAISSDTVVYDEVEKEEVSKMNIYNALKGRIFVTLNKGGIEFTAKYGDDKKNSWKIDQSEATKVLDYNFIDEDQDYLWDPIVFEIKNIDSSIDSYYSIHVSVESNPKINAIALKAGYSTYLFFGKNGDQECIKGHFINSSEKVYLTVDQFEKEKLEKLEVTLQIDGKEASFHEHTIQNIKQISFDRQSAIDTILTPLKYVLCVTDKNEDQEIIELKVLQAGTVNILQSEQSAIIHGTQDIFMFHPLNSFLLDTFVCQGKLGIKYSGSYNDLFDQSLDFEFIDSLDKTSGLETQDSHANYYEDDSLTVFTRFSPDAVGTIRWMELDQDNELGMGYANYKAGGISYDALANQMTLMWEPIRAQTADLKSKIMEVTYTIFITETMQKTKGAANCAVLSQENFFAKSEIFGSERHKQASQNGKWMQIIIEKQSIRKWFKYVKNQEEGQFKDTQSNQNAPEMLFVTVVAQLNLVVPGSQGSQAVSEYYRFIYDIHSLSLREVLEDGVVSQKIPFVALIAAAALVGMLSVGCLLYIVLKKMVPLISRLRRSTFLEEEIKQDSKPTIDENADSHKNLEADANV